VVNEEMGNDREVGLIDWETYFSGPRSSKLSVSLALMYVLHGHIFMNLYLASSDHKDNKLHHWQ
jgi:hypothetical protein